METNDVSSQFSNHSMHLRSVRHVPMPILINILVA